VAKKPKTPEVKTQRGVILNVYPRSLSIQVRLDDDTSVRFPLVVYANGHSKRAIENGTPVLVVFKPDGSVLSAHRLLD